jgi:hypothetical protein
MSAPALQRRSGHGQGHARRRFVGSDGLQHPRSRHRPHPSIILSQPFDPADETTRCARLYGSDEKLAADTAPGAGAVTFNRASLAKDLSGADGGRYPSTTQGLPRHWEFYLSLAPELARSSASRGRGDDSFRSDAECVARLTREHRPNRLRALSTAGTRLTLTLVGRIHPEPPKRTVVGRFKPPRPIEKRPAPELERQERVEPDAVVGDPGGVLGA